MISSAVSFLPPTVTPTRSLPVIVNVASSVSSTAFLLLSIACLLMTMVEGASATTILVVPSAWMLALVMPSVTALLEVITPFSIVKLNSVVTAVKPFGAAVSLSV